MEVDVLTYNIEGLPWPGRSGRARHLQEISRVLRQLRAEGQAPHIVLFQEVFSRAARRAVEETGYPTLVPGPEARDRRPAPVNGSLPGRSRPLKGELGLRALSSGLVIATDFPVLAHKTMPFPRRSCAGYDCLANKGVQLARLRIPGLPGFLDIYNTHMNSQDTSGVPEPRHLAAHQAQTVALSAFIARNSDGPEPFIFGGDLNMRHSEPRFAELQRLKPIHIVHRWCVERPAACDVRESWDGDEPWMDTQDLQLFWPGAHVDVRPAVVEAMFDGAAEPRLSDHDGFRVRYTLSWSVADAPPTGPCTPPDW